MATQARECIGRDDRVGTTSLVYAAHSNEDACAQSSITLPPIRIEYCSTHDAAAEMLTCSGPRSLKKY
eukprot:845319-Pleurochrysis_carterae.AAC.3